MLISRSELSKKAKVTKSAVSNWVNTRKKIYLNSDGLIDTEDSRNVEFLKKVCPSLYENANIPKESPPIRDLKSLLLANAIADSEENDSKTAEEVKIQIDALNETECKEILNYVLNHDPKSLLTIAQYKKADTEEKMKKIDLLEKVNHKFDRAVVENHFLSFIKIMHDNSRRIIYGIVDEIIAMVLKEGASCRNKIIEVADEKYIEQTKAAHDSFKKCMQKEYPIGVIPKDSEDSK